MTKEWEAEFYRLVTALADANFECGAWAEGDGSYEHLTDKQAEARKALCEFVLSSRPEVKEYAEIGYLLKNQYGFVSAGVPNLADIKIGQTAIYKRIEPQNTHEEG